MTTSGLPGVTVATVTYGDRAGVCIRVVERALSAGAMRAIVVDNGSVGRSAEQLHRWAKERSEIEVVRLAQNEGSASGFRTALQHAGTIGLPWIWLLDDDNLAAENSLRVALAVAEQEGPKALIACLRTADEMQVALLNGAAVKDTLDVRGSFVGFDLLHRLRRNPNASQCAPVDAVEIPWAPYGGLLLRSEAVTEAGLPARSFVLYGDDRDYCERLRAAGYRIVLSRAATVEDITDRWDQTGSAAPGASGHLSAMIRSGDSRRAYYLVRNSVFDDRRRARRDRARARLLMNAIVFLSYVAVQAARLGRPRFFFLALKAALVGFSGRWYSER